MIKKHIQSIFMIHYLNLFVFFQSCCRLFGDVDFDSVTFPINFYTLKMLLFFLLFAIHFVSQSCKLTHPQSKLSVIASCHFKGHSHIGPLYSDWQMCQQQSVKRTEKDLFILEQGVCWKNYTLKKAQVSVYRCYLSIFKHNNGVGCHLA